MKGTVAKPDSWICRYLADVAMRIRDKRLALRLTQAAVAEKLDWARTTIVALESGRQEITLRQMLLLACALRCEPFELLPFALWNAEERRTAAKLAEVPPRQRPRRRRPPRPPGAGD
jgi:transcriptional regulator with XRE-family HTH domain